MTAGTDMFADTNDVASIRAAYLQGLFSTARLDDAARRLTTEMFALGLFDNPYVDPERADTIVASDEHRAAAERAHRKSVVLLKNRASTLPLRPEELGDRLVYVDLFEVDLRVSALDELRARFAAAHPQVRLTTDYHFADVAIVLLNPTTGSYFSSTGLIDLGIHHGSHVDLDKITAIRAEVDQLIIGLNVKFPWLLGTVEPLADALVCGFDTRKEVVLDAIMGAFAPTGRLPLTFPINDDAIAVDENGSCASPNDVPGWAKERHMDGRPYVYVDGEGNHYVHGFGLTY